MTTVSALTGGSKKNVAEMSFVMAQKLIRTGQIRIDGKRVKPDTRLVAGQEIRLPPMDNAPKKQMDTACAKMMRT